MKLYLRLSLIWIYMLELKCSMRLASSENWELLKYNTCSSSKKKHN